MTNSASGDPLTVSVPIKQEAGVLTTVPESIPITANSLISPHTETQEIKATFGDSAEPLPFTVEIRIGGALIQEWLTADTLSDYISASFASQAATLSLRVSDNTISVDGLTNAENGVEGSFDFSSLPSGFTVDPKTITLPDPDGPKISATTITPSSSTFTITDTVNSTNTQPYTINTIALAELSDEAQQVAELIEDSKPADATYTVRVDRTTPDTPFIVIDGLTNTASGDPLTVSVPIKQEAGVLTTDLESISIIANSLISPHTDTREIKATFGASAEPLPFTVEIRIGGALIQEWLTADTFSSYISASFASQAATLTLRVSDNTISVDGLTNAENGVEGSFDFSSLPSGFTVDPETITLPDPDGSDIIAATITPSSSTFTITDTVNSKNTQPYTINTIALAELSVFTPGIHISVSDESRDITSTLAISVDENNSNLITITNLTNTVGEQKIYTLTISPPDSGIFSTPNDSPITITITEPDGFSPDDATLSSTDFTVTNRGDTTGTTYTLTVPVSGAPIQEWLTADTFSNYFTGATFAGQTGSLSFDGSSITIDGTSGAAITNVPDGDILLTTAADLPTGYSITGHDTLTDPDGPAVAEITDGDAGSITISEVDNPKNSEEYPVHINLAAYSSPVEASHVTAMFNGDTADPSNIEIRGNEIIISGFDNIAGSTGSGSVSITPTAAYTIDPDPFPLDFTDPEGTAFAEIILDSVNVRSNDLTVSHNIIVRLDAILTLIITNSHVENSSLTISERDTVTIANLEACNVLPPSTIEVVNAPGLVVKNFPRYFDRRIDMTVDTPPVYQLSRSLIIEDADGNIVDSDFPITMKGFPDCDSNALTGTGEDAANAYEIDTATKLELLSHLVNSDNANYGSKFYKLTADIDLGLAGLPWSETASGESGEGFPPIGVDETTSFRGTFDCDGKTISNLYMNRSYTINVGIFRYTLNATIQDCSLVEVKVIGRQQVGGLVGVLNNSSITNSYATGSVSGGERTGGLVGYMNTSSNITNSYATGSVSGESSVGGLVGHMAKSSITNSYATGSVSGTFDVAGLVGSIYNESSITNSYATGFVSATSSYLGGLVRSVTLNSTVTNSYWDTTTSRQASSAGGTPKTTADLQSDIYTGWDDTIWQFSNDQYPRLKTVACANRQYAMDQSIACGVLQ